MYLCNTPPIQRMYVVPPLYIGEEKKEQHHGNCDAALCEELTGEFLGGQVSHEALDLASDLGFHAGSETLVSRKCHSEGILIGEDSQCSQAVNDACLAGAILAKPALIGFEGSEDRERERRLIISEGRGHLPAKDVDSLTREGVTAEIAIRGESTIRNGENLLVLHFLQFKKVN